MKRRPCFGSIFRFELRKILMPHASSYTCSSLYQRIWPLCDIFMAKSTTKEHKFSFLGKGVTFLIANRKLSFTTSFLLFKDTHSVSWGILFNSN